MKTPPMLAHSKNPFQEEIDYSKRDRDLERAIFNCLTNVGEIKLMLFYTSYQHMKNYRPAEKTIREYVNMSHDCFSRNRSNLQKKGWITIDKGVLTINYEKIYDDYMRKIIAEDA